MTSHTKEVPHESVHRQKTLRVRNRLKPTHLSVALAGRLVRYLCLPKTSYARFEWPTALAWGRRTKASVSIADWRALEVGGWLASVGRSSGRHVGVHGLPALADRGDRQAA